MEHPMSELDALKAQIQNLAEQGKISRSPTNEQRIDWAYANAKIENDDVTREMAEQAVYDSVLP